MNNIPLEEIFNIKLLDEDSRVNFYNALCSTFNEAYSGKYNSIRIPYHVYLKDLRNKYNKENLKNKIKVLITEKGISHIELWDTVTDYTIKEKYLSKGTNNYRYDFDEKIYYFNLDNNSLIKIERL